MDELVRRAALRATAKVALSLTVLGCAGVVDVEHDEPGATRRQPAPEPDSDARFSDTSRLSGPRPSGELQCGAAPPGQEVVLDDLQFECCGDLVVPEAPQTPEQWDAWIQAEHSPAIYACCNVLVAHGSAEWSKVQEVGFATISACCNLLGDPASPACTPWGPPAPPAFDPSLSAAWRLEVV